MLKGDKWKDDGGKPMWNLLDMSIIQEMAMLLTEGLKDHDIDGWKNIESWRHENALQRHFTDRQCGEVFDKTNAPHSVSMLVNAYFIRWHEKYKKGILYKESGN